MPNPFVISILTLITTLATTPTIANTDLNTPNKTTAIVGLNLQANAVNSDNANNAVNTANTNNELHYPKTSDNFLKFLI